MKMAAQGVIDGVFFSRLWRMCATVLILSVFITTFNPSVAQSSSLMEDQSDVTSTGSISSWSLPSTHLQNQPTPTSVLQLHSPQTTTSTTLSPSPTPAPMPEPDPYMIFANVDVIYRVGLDESNFAPLINGSSLVVKAVAVDYDIRRKLLFWSDVKKKIIVKSHLDGSNPRIIVDDDLTLAESLAWDWIGQKLYWTDSKHMEIEVADIYTGHRTQLVYTGNETAPRALVLDPNTRYLYWTDWGEVAKIERMSMDGTMREVLHDTDLVWPNGITLDYTTQTLYWVDASLDRIESSFTNGSHRRLVSTYHVYHPFSIVFFNNVLYWSDWRIDQVIYARLSSVANVQGLVPALNSDPYAMKVVSLDAQPISTENPCEVNNGNCSHLCLPSAASDRSFTCACPKGAQLSDNGTQCVYDSPTASPLPSPGSCRDAGYSSCCMSGICEGHGLPLCFCDLQCVTFSDCCKDFTEICDIHPTANSSVLSTASPTESLATSLRTVVSPSATTKSESPIQSSTEWSSHSMRSLDLQPSSSSSSSSDSSSSSSDSSSSSSSIQIVLTTTSKPQQRSQTVLSVGGTSTSPKESSRPNAMQSSSEFDLQASTDVSTSSQQHPQGSRTTASAFPEDSEDKLNGRILLLGAVGVVSLLSVLIVMVLSMLLVLCILRRRRSRAVVSSSSSSFGINNFDDIGELSRKASFKESMDSGVDLDMKVDSRV